MITGVDCAAGGEDRTSPSSISTEPGSHYAAYLTDFREYLTNINLLPPSTGTATGEEGWKHHERN